MAPLVEYSDSEAEENTQPSKSTPQAALRIKRRKHAGAKQEQTPAVDMPPLPPTFHDLYATASRVSTVDDPALHGGRKRVTPHVEGNWPTHIYLECKRYSLCCIHRKQLPSLYFRHLPSVSSLLRMQAAV